MVKITIGFFIGIGIFLQLSEFPPLALLLLLLPCGLLLRFNRLRLVAYIAFGFVWTWFRADIILSSSLHQDLQNVPIEIIGEIVSLPEETQFGHRFRFEIQQPIAYKQKQYQPPHLIQLHWSVSEQMIQPGMRLRCVAKLKPPYGFANLGGFDYEYWLFHQGIRATGAVSKNSGCEVLGKSSNNLIQSVRYSLKRAIVETDQPSPLDGLVLALLIGDKSLITAEQWAVLQNTGTSHLLAISGLHVGLVFGLGFYLACLVARCLPFLLLKMPAQRMALFVGLAFSWFYAALAGFSLPTLRALVMLIITLVSVFCYLKISLTKLVFLSLFIILLMDPFAVRTAGFWLSYSAVCLILYGVCYRVNTDTMWWQWGRVQVLMAIGLVPLGLYWFQTTAEFGFLANSIAIPMVSIFIVPVLLLYAFCSLCIEPWADSMGLLVQYGMSVLWRFLEWVALLPNFEPVFVAPSFTSLIIAGLGVFWLLLPSGFPGRYLGLMLFLPLLLSTTSKPEDGELWLHVLDVGQGTAVIIQTQEQSILYDTGAKFSEKFNAGAAVVVPALKKLGINKLDKLIISHADNDHIGGLVSILRSIPVDTLLFNGELALSEFSVKAHHACDERSSWQHKTFRFEILHPSSSHEMEHLSRNQSSCVLQISGPHHKILLTGDIDYRIELELVSKYAKKLQSDIVLVPHHGSKTSSSEPFLDSIAPKYAIVTTGYQNRFGFPKEVIMQRYQRRDVEMFNTAERGMLTFKLHGKDVSVLQYRAENRRFWHTIL